MKRVFYKIFFAFLMCSYIPLIAIFIMNYLYTTRYLENDTKNKMIELVNVVDIDQLKLKQKYDEKSGAYFRYMNMEEQSELNSLFKLFNKLEVKTDIRNIPIGDYVVKEVKLSRITNHFYLIKKISEKEVITVTTEIINPKLIKEVILKFYKTYSLIALPLIFIVTYILSQKFAKTIETLEKISTQISNSNFTETVDIKSKNELESLGNNINKMAKQLQNNIEELSTLNERLKKELKEKENLLETEKNFMRAIGHELKTPVAIITGYIEALQDEMIEEKDIKKTYEIIYNEGMSISKLVKDINDYLKLEFHHGDPIFESTNIKNLIENSLEKYYLDILQREIKLNKIYKETEIKTDAKLLGIVLNNLLTNALTYVDERKELEIELTKNELRISNSSEYISKETFEKIFNPFYKIDKSRNRKYGGTGLGLSIVKNLLEILKFEYSFTYDENRKFAVFTIKFL